MRHLLYALILAASATAQQTPSFTPAWKDGSNVSGSAAAWRTAIGLGNVNNTSDANKPVSTLTSTALGLKVDLSALSTNGTANKVLQYDSFGDLVTGTTNNNVIMDYGGNVRIPDKRGLTWLKRDGSQSGFFVMAWEDHDAYGGELLIESPWRLAFTVKGPIQVGRNDAVRSPTCFEMTTGAATVTDQTKPSHAINYLTKMWNGGSPIGGSLIQQAWPVAANSAVSTLRTYARGIVWGKDGGAPDAATGNATGTLISELAEEGTWTPGLAPAFAALTDGATITQTCSKYLSVQAASVQLGGNRTLALSGQLAGMRGVIYVKQDATGSRTLTLPNGSATPSSWALSTAPYTVDRLSWEFDGVYTYWTITAGITLPFDADADAFLTRAGITTIPADNTKRTAINNLTLSIKGAGLWSKMHAIYPFIGGNASAHSKNLKADAYNITWYNTITHNSDGVTGDGSTGYGLTTGLTVSGVSGQNNFAGGVYCKTASPTIETHLFGTIQTNANFGKWRSNGTGVVMWTPAPNTASTNDHGDFPTGVNFKNHFYVSRYSATEYITGQFGLGGNGNTVKTFSSAAAGTYPLGILSASTGSVNAAGERSNANLAFAWFAQGLSFSEITALNGFITTYQTALSRQN